MAGFKRGGARGGGGGSFTKASQAKKRTSLDDEDSAPPASKRSKADDEEEEESQAVVPKLAKDDEGNDYVSLNTSGKRRATVSEFKNNTLISIREYWSNDDGELKPGKKGISLTVDQYQTLLASAPLFESVLAKKGIKLTRPDYEADPNVEKSGESEETEEVKPTGNQIDNGGEEVNEHNE